MVLGIISVVLALLIAYIWSTRGFFSALIHMLCTIIAGAVAFALWEKIGYALLGASTPRGFFSWLDGVAWGVALMLPFVLVLVILRVGVDSILRANVHIEPAVNYVGGGICGLISGIITVGMLVMSVGMLRMESDLGFLGYKPVEYADKSGLVRVGGGMILPVDKLTASTYSFLAERAFSVDEPLGKWHPNFAEFGASNRLNYQGKGRNTVRPGRV